MKLRESNVIFSWSANSIVNVPILFAVFGFLFAILVFSGGSGKVRFQEVALANKDSLSKLVVNNRIDNLTKYIDSIKKDSGHDDNDYKQAKDLRTNSYNELDNISSGNYSLKIFSDYAYIHSDSLKVCISSLENLHSKEQYWNIPIQVVDTCKMPTNSHLVKKIDLRLTISEMSLIDFISDNSTFGFWFFLSIAQMCLWFLLIPLVIGSVKQTDDIGVRYDLKSALIFSVIPMMFIGLFAYLLYWQLIDKYVIDDIFIMKSYNMKMIFYSIPGYFTAILCFSSYLFLSNNLEILDRQPTPINEKEEQYKSLSKAFNFSFICSTIVLTVFVFWVAILFNAINETEIMKFYKLETGYLFLNNDFIYLIGLMHSLLLFIFYVPVKLRFSSLKISQEQKQLEVSGLSTGKIIWKNVVELFSTIIVTTSPLIAPLIKKLLDILSS